MRYNNLWDNIIIGIGQSTTTTSAIFCPYSSGLIKLIDCATVFFYKAVGCLVIPVSFPCINYYLPVVSHIRGKLI